MNSLLKDISRRAFVERFAKAVFGVSLLPASSALRASESKIGQGKSVIFLYMRGGISHIDTFDPKPGGLRWEECRLLQLARTACRFQNGFRTWRNRCIMFRSSVR